MDYFKNADKISDTCYSGQNSVLGRPQFSGEAGTEPVLLAEAKLWCKIESDQTEDDAIVTALIKAARRKCEQFVNLGFITRTVTANINNPNGNFYLPYGPVTNTPTATDGDGNALDVTWQLGLLKAPLGESTVTYNAGYDELPEELKTALKEQIIYMHEHRGEGTSDMSPMAKQLLQPLRVV